MAIEVISINKKEQSKPDIHACVQPKERLIRKPEVLGRTGLSSSSLYQKISESKFPAPIHPYGPRVSLWREKDVDTFIGDILTAAGMGIKA